MQKVSPIKVVNLGMLDYKEALEFQLEQLRLRQQDKCPDQIFMLEHPPVYTMGLRDSSKAFLRAPSSLEIPVVQTNRGGELTYHGPGQLIGYLIIKLPSYGIKELVSRIELSFIKFLADTYAIQAYQDQRHRGVWVNSMKLVAIGLAIKSAVTMHGFAFNINTKLQAYEDIIPCGIADRGVGSLKEIIKDSTPKLNLANSKPTDNADLDFDKITRTYQNYLVNELQR